MSIILSVALLCHTIDCPVRDRPANSPTACSAVLPPVLQFRSLLCSSPLVLLPIPQFCPLFCGSATSIQFCPLFCSSAPCSAVLLLVLQFCPLFCSYAPCARKQGLSTGPKHPRHTCRKFLGPHTACHTRIKDSQINNAHQLTDRIDIK